MFAIRRSILLLTAAVLIGGCASSPYQEWRQRADELGCDDYGMVSWPVNIELFPHVEPIPEECLNPPTQWTLVGYERVTIYDAETGSTTSAIVPAGTVIVK